MLSCDNVWAECKATDITTIHVHQRASVETSPQLTRVLRAYRLLPRQGLDPLGEKALLRLRHLLGLSLAELREAICPLRAIVDDGQRRRHLEELFISVSDVTLHKEPSFGSTVWALACGGMRVMTAVINGQAEPTSG
jgi:hypothetical protein